MGWDGDEERLTSCVMFEGPSRGDTLRRMVSIYSCLFTEYERKDRSIIYVMQKDLDVGMRGRCYLAFDWRQMWCHESNWLASVQVTCGPQIFLASHVLSSIVILFALGDAWPRHC
jgi:hypothetical protein